MALNRFTLKINIKKNAIISMIKVIFKNNNTNHLSQFNYIKVDIKNTSKYCIAINKLTFYNNFGDKMLVIHELKPIFNSQSQILILGSMPSVISRQEKFYYANKNNRFWKIFEILFQVNLSNNNQKKQFLLDHHIALWDVFKSCEIKGSSDQSIKKYKLNDITEIINKSQIKAIFCTGKAAYNNLIKNFKTSLPIFCLPSTSSANATFKLNDLIKEYSIIKNYL